MLLFHDKNGKNLRRYALEHPFLEYHAEDVNLSYADININVHQHQNWGHM